MNTGEVGVAGVGDACDDACDDASEEEPGAAAAHPAQPAQPVALQPLSPAIAAALTSTTPSPSPSFVCADQVDLSGIIASSSPAGERVLLDSHVRQICLVWDGVSM